MANARSKFDYLVDYLCRNHETVAAPLFGKPALLLHSEPFIVFHIDGMALRLRGRQRLQASVLSGAKYWSPLGRDNPSMEWVSVPVAHFLRWDRLAIEALHQRQQHAGSQPVAEAAQGPTPPPPVSLRWADNIKALLLRIQNLALVPIEPRAPKAIESTR